MWCLRPRLALCLLSLGVCLYSQQRITVNQSNVPNVSLTPFDETRVAFAPFFEDAATAKVRPFSAVLVNATDKPITGLTVRWSWTDAAGKQRTHDVTTDSYFLSREVVLPARSEMLIGPGVLLPAPLVGRGSVGAIASQLERELSQFDRASAVTLTLDTVIFEDGSVLGPDQSQTLLSLYARKVAAESLVQAVQTARTSGKAAPMVIQEIASRRPTDRSDHVGLWTMRLAGHMQRAGDAEDFLAELARLTALPLRRVH